MEKDWLDRFLAQLAGRPAVLDIGCGSGDPIARYLVSAGCRMTGVDSSQGLLAMCKDKFPAHRWLEGDMRTLCLGQKFDGILAWDSFFFLRPEDQRKMFGIFRDHSAPGGSLMFTSGTSHGVVIGEYRGEPLYHASLDPGEYRLLLRTNGFEVTAHAVEDPGCGGRTVWLARRG
ncbi:MAG: class I SAM-dependent methyltransferase [Sinobacteraceae bacterium]|nr:class I SAM-dependent methyltransferase [Nevskiaceae bacterium]